MCGIHHVYADAYPIVDARSVALPHLTTVARRGCQERCDADVSLQWGEDGFGQSALGEQVRAIAPECYAQAETQDNFRDRKSSKLPPTFRGYSNNLKADLIYAKFHVDSVVAARERRHIDQLVETACSNFKCSGNERKKRPIQIEQKSGNSTSHSSWKRPTQM